MSVSILVVDDDPALVQVTGAMLSDLGRVRFATSGQAALRQIALERPDIVLLDAEMPEMGGFEVCRRIRASNELDDIPVIFVTMHTDEAFEARCLEAGAVDFLHKPVSRLLMRARVQTHLRLKQALDTVRRMALSDALTGLPNRRAFDHLFERAVRDALREGESLTLFLIDVDCFKQYNDLYGHPAGDACLSGVARAVAGALCRPTDVAARYGGEEFVVLLPKVAIEGAQQVGARILQAVSELRIPHQRSVFGPEGHVSASIGGAVWDGGAAAASECADAVADGLAVLTVADEALYSAKSAGRARLCLRSPDGSHRADGHPT